MKMPRPIDADGADNTYSQSRGVIVAHRTKRPAKRKESSPAKPAKPEKPYPGFPLFPHDSGQWAKKIRGKLHYFGVWADPNKALEKLNREYPYLKDGRTPPPEHISADGITLRELANDYLASKESKVNDGSLSVKAFRDYHRTCEIILDAIGKDRRVDDLRPDDFRKYRSKLAKRFSVTTLSNEITRARMIFNYAYENELIDKPVRYGQEFDYPPKKQIRRHRNQSGRKDFTRDEVLQILGKADIHMRAMIHLGLNCGFGNADCGKLTLAAVDLETGWVTFPRVKTEIERRIPLWSETVQALRKSLENRPEPKSKDDAGLFFITAKTRWGWYRTKLKKPKGDEKPEGPKDEFLIDSIGTVFAKILRELGINGRRGFYGFRHCFETVAGESRDQVAVNAIMGHADNTMAANYRHGISDDRLLAVVNVVREWLWPADESGEESAE